MANLAEETSLHVDIEIPVVQPASCILHQSGHPTSLP